MDDHDLAAAAPRTTVTASINYLDATSPAERETLRKTVRQIVDLLFDLFAALPAHGPPPAGFTHEGLLVFPPAYVGRYDRAFVKRAIVAAVSLGQKMASPMWFDLGSTMEEMLFGTMLETVQNADVEIGDVLDELEESIFQDLDYEMLFNAQFDGIENDEMRAQYAFANLGFDEWFHPFTNTSFLNYYFPDARVLTAPVEHRLYDPNALRGAFEYATGDDPPERET